MGYTKKDVITKIQTLSFNIGKTPSLQDYRNDKNNPSQRVLYTFYDSWNEALEDAGFTIHKYLTKEELIELLKQFNKEFNKVPTCRSLTSAKEYPSAATYRRNFGSWNNALELAGFKKNLTKANITHDKNYIIECIKNYVKKHGKVPTSKQFDADKSFPCTRTVVAYCGSWKTAIEESGFTYVNSGYGVQTTGLDGILYRSQAEAYFSDTFLYQKYTYDVEPKYPEPYNRYYDWHIKELDLYIELDGGCRPAAIDTKTNIIKELNINCIIIPIKAIYKTQCLAELITKYKVTN